MAAAAFTDIVDLVRALAWPVTVIVALLLLRPHLPQAAKWLSRRISKLSVASVTLELSASEVPPQILGSLSYLRDPLSSVYPSSDATQQLIGLVRGAERADSATIDLGTGKRWLTSRLYIFSWILAEFVGVRCLVFVETRDGIPHRFVGLAEPGAVRSSLARRQAWLEDAFAAAHLDFSAPDCASAFDDLKKVLADPAAPLKELWATAVQTPLTRLFAAAYETPQDAQGAELLATRYRESPLVARNVHPADPQAKGWLRLGKPTEMDPPTIREERASWIRGGTDLEALLRASLEYTTIVVDPVVTGQELQRQVVLREGGDFVALVDREGRFERLLDRRRVTERIGHEAAEQGLVA